MTEPKGRGRGWKKDRINPKQKWQPPREGPLWELFLQWWYEQDIEEQRRSVAWKGFYAAYMLKDLFK